MHARVLPRPKTTSSTQGLPVYKGIQYEVEIPVFTKQTTDKLQGIFLNFACHAWYIHSVKLLFAHVCLCISIMEYSVLLNFPLP